MSERLVIVGGDAAGMSAAMQARRARRDLEIVVLERGLHTSYSACGIPYLVGGDVDDPDDLVVRRPEEFRERFLIDVRIRHEVTGLDLRSRTVEIRDLARERTYSLGFDQLLLATGASPVRPSIPGIDLPHVHGVQTLDDGIAILREADRRDCQSVVVIGGGYIGLEMAEAFLHWGSEVTVLERSTHVMGTLDPDMASLVEEAMRRHEIDVRTDVVIEGIDEKVVLTSDGPIEADLVILGTGVTPNSSLAADAGLELGAKGAVRVDRRQRASVEGVWAAGDCAESFHLVSRKPVHVALGTVANRQGRVAGINLGGGYATFPGVLGTAVTKLCATEIARTGLNEREATEAGFEFAAVKIESTTRAGYFPGARPIVVKFVAERGTGRLLGAQIVGEEGAAKRIDVVATAIWSGLTVDEMIDLDLSYAPPFSPVWDPVAVAARAASKQIRT
ncbi:MAG: flavoprotein oxidoreductase [Acidimicrobiales bacterium]|nr:MAG: flavoprotein oxidoreductase [Acidimicrobiales bacterium]